MLQTKQENRQEIVITLDAKKLNALHDMIYEFAELESLETPLSQLICTTLRYIYLFRFGKLLIDPARPTRQYNLKITHPEAMALMFSLNDHYDQASPYQQTVIRLVIDRLDKRRHQKPSLENVIS